MATNTTNYSLVKPAYSDTADIADINGNMDKVDAALQGIDSAIAIVATGNTHAAVTENQYVYVHGHGSLAEGLYTAKNNISANATLSTSNLQSVSGGIGNKVKSMSDRIDELGNLKVDSITLFDASTGAVEFTDSGDFLVFVRKENLGANYMGFYLLHVYLTNSSFPNNRAGLVTVVATPQGLSSISVSASTTEKKATLTFTSTTTFMTVKLVRS